MSKKENRLKIFSALEVANICGVVNQTSINWIKNRHLKAFTTPGGQYRVYAEDLIDFLENRGMKLPESLLLLSINTGKGRGKEKKNKILVIDSDKNFTDLLSDKIMKADPECVIKTAANSFEAGTYFAEDNPEIIILSDTMSDLTPLKIKELCLNKNCTKKLRIIYLCGTGSTHKGADLVLGKPADIGKIINYAVQKRGE